MRPFIEDHLDVRNLPMRTHANMIKSEKTRADRYELSLKASGIQQHL